MVVTAVDTGQIVRHRQREERPLWLGNLIDSLIAGCILNVRFSERRNHIRNGIYRVSDEGNGATVNGRWRKGERALSSMGAADAAAASTITQRNQQSSHRLTKRGT